MVNFAPMWAVLFPSRRMRVTRRTRDRAHPLEYVQAAMHRCKYSVLRMTLCACAALFPSVCLSPAEKNNIFTRKKWKTTNNFGT